MTFISTSYITWHNLVVPIPPYTLGPLCCNMYVLSSTDAVASVNALSMLEPSQQWLLYSTPLHQALQPPVTYNAPQHPPRSSLPDGSNSDSQAQGLLNKCKKGVRASVVVLSSRALPEGCNQYTDLTKQHAAAQAHATLAQLEPEAAYRPTVADDVYHRLLASGEHSGLYEQRLLGLSGQHWA